FQALMKDFVQTNFNRDVSTEDFKRIVEKHMSKDMDLDGNQRLDWFFNEWVYGTEMPSYRFEYQLGADGTTLSGKITQSGVSETLRCWCQSILILAKAGSELAQRTLRAIRR